LIIVGSVPIAITGFLLQDWIENEIRSPVVASAMLIIFAFVLLLAERIGSGDRSIHEARPKDALAIGGAQAMALIPGVSRSGITISAGLVRGLDRSSAARFSFLLSTPAIGGAALLTLGDAISEGVIGNNLDIIVAGFVTSAVVGWFAIAVLMRILQTHTFLPIGVGAGSSSTALWPAHSSFSTSRSERTQRRCYNRTAYDHGRTTSPRNASVP
jgi:undecaprenyl-diphosphatase